MKANSRRAGAADPLAGVVLDGLSIVPVAPVEVMSRLRDKWSFHQLCLQTGVSTPMTWRYEHKAAIDIDHHLA